jgi:hypothetical protein
MPEYTILTKRVMDEPDSGNDIHNDLILLGRTSNTDIVFGMAVAGVTSNVEKNKVISERLMQEPS